MTGTGASRLDDFWAALGDKIREARKDQGMSASELAEYLGYTETAVLNYEKARRHISLEDLLRVSERTGKPITWFFGAAPGEAFEQHLAELLRRPLADYLPAVSVPVHDEIGVDTDDLGERHAGEEILVDRSLNASFAYKVRDSAMAGAFVFRGDIAICAQRPPKHGDIVLIAIPEGPATLRYLIGIGEEFAVADAPGPGISPTTMTVRPDQVKGVVVQVIRAPEHDDPGPVPADEWSIVWKAAQDSGLTAEDLLKMISAWRATRSTT